jgi:membrane fusion protein, adhesin transport system
MTMRDDQSLSAKDLNLLDDMQRAMRPERRWGLLATTVLLSLMLVAFVAWAASSALDEVTRGTGRVIPSSREQIIQSIDAGTVSEMLVREGDVVQAGQPLLRLDKTRSTAGYREALNKSQALEATAARLRAEAHGVPLRFGKLPAELVEREKIAYAARSAALNESVAGLRNSQALLEREIAITEPMVKEGVMSEVELLRMKRQASDLRTQIAERINKFRSDANTELLRAESEAAQTREVVTGRADSVSRTEIRAPLRGVVKNIRINTIGGVAAAGQDILEIVPLDDTLLIETFIRPSDVAFIRPGLAAVVKLSAYDYTVYGGLDGKVEFISPDTLRDDKRSSASALNLNPDESYYRVIVRTTGNALTDPKGGALPIIPGMTAAVDIKTGEKTVLQYLFKPISRLQDAMRER